MITRDHLTVRNAIWTSRKRKRVVNEGCPTLKSMLDTHVQISSDGDSSGHSLVNTRPRYPFTARAVIKINRYGTFARKGSNECWLRATLAILPLSVLDLPCHTASTF